MAGGGVLGATGLVSLILIASSLLFLFFIILSGNSNVTPLNKTYFLQANTSKIAGARPISQWTYFYICGDGNTDCGNAVPDLPFGYAWVGGGSGAPDALLGSYGKHTTSHYYFFMWRFAWAFYLIALVADAFALITSLLAPCSRLASGIAGFFVVNALFWMTLAASLMTVTFVKARNVFQSAGMDASLGRYAFGWTWAAWFAMLVATILLFLGCGVSRKSSNGILSSSGGLFRRNRSKRSTRGSFVDAESQRRVKEEYN